MIRFGEVLSGNRKGAPGAPWRDPGAPGFVRLGVGYAEKDIISA